MILSPSNTVLTRVQAGYLTAGQPFGTWNGTATSATLVNRYGATPNQARAVNIWRNDWQGNQLLWPTPRTNEVLNSAASTTDWYPAGSASWGAAAPSTPSGSGTAYILVAGTTSNVQEFIPHTGTINASSSLAGFVDVAPYGYEYGALSGQLSAGGVNTGVFDFSTGLFLGLPYTYGGAPADNLQQWAIALPNGYYRLHLSFSLTSPQTNITNPLAYGIWDSPTGQTFAGDGTHGVYAANAQIVPDAPLGSLITTTGSPVTLTDYTLSGTTVNLAQAPASGATTTSTYYAT